MNVTAVTYTNLTAELEDIVRELEPLVLAHAPTAEAERRMAPEVMSALADSGLMKMWVPKELGGMELPPNAALSVMETLARTDPATGWVVSNSVFISMLYQFLPAPVLDDLLGKPDVVTCGSFVPPGKATENTDGYTLNGTWSFGSATDYATSLVVLSWLTDDDGPVLGAEGDPVTVLAFLDPDDVTLLDTWYTLGLRATGSTHFKAEAVDVPRDRTYLLGPWEQTEGPFTGPLYRLGLIVDAVRIAQVGIGIAQGALEEFVELASTKTPAYTETLTADRATVQERVARAQALVQAGRHTLAAAVAEGWDSVQDGSRITGPACVPMGLAASFALDAAVQAVDLLYESGGSTAFRDESPLQTRFRDLQTLRQNAIASWSRYESLGKFILGRQSDWPFHLL
ncbi:MAG: acyl-CoA dehydrogenase family protein [Acidimicrobiia bacterium]|nr:acyl-CoA dehydrogenase family protein [Acidimicrobiia bacterium]